MSMARGGRGGGAASIPNDYFFANNTLRDDYFAANPSQLRAEIYVSVAGQMQKYDGAAWIDATPIITGPAGNNAPNMLIQYSADGSTGWTGTLNTAIHKYWRWSTDNGATWSPNGVKYSADGAGLTAQQEQDLTDNTAARHTHANQAVLDATTGTFTLARQNKLDGVQDTWKGVFTSAAAINAAFPTPIDGWACWNTDTATVWSASGGAWADTLATSTGDMLKATYDPQGVAADAFDRANHTGTQAIATVTGLQTELDKLPTMQGEIDALELRLDDPSTGLVKAIGDLDTQINEAGTGVIARLDDLENGGAGGGVTFDNQGVNATNNVWFEGYDNGVSLRMRMDGDTASLLYAKNSGRWRLNPPVTSGTVLGQDDLLCVRDANTIFPRMNRATTAQAVTLTVSSLSSAISFGNGTTTHSLVYDDSAKRWTQTFTPTSVATSDQSILTRWDGDRLYARKGSTTINPSRVLVSGTDAGIASSSVTTTELDRLAGVTSGVQSQLNSLSSDKLSLSGGTMTGNLEMNNKDIRGCNLVQINDEGLNEGLMFPNWGLVQDGSSLVICSGTWNAVTNYNDSNRTFYFATDQFSCMNARSGQIRLGSTSARWNGVFSTSNINVSSDEELKTNIKHIPDALLDVWFDHVQPCSYELIASQGSKQNRIEVGLIAQDVIAAFEAAGLDWHEWNVVCENSDFGDESGENDYYSLNYSACALIEAMVVRRKMSIKPSRRFAVRGWFDKLLWGERGKK